jgi:hypothetical protein
VRSLCLHLMLVGVVAVYTPTTAVRCLQGHDWNLHLHVRVCVRVLWQTPTNASSPCSLLILLTLLHCTATHFLALLLYTPPGI